MKELRLAVTATALLLHNVHWTVAFAPHLRLATRPRLGVKGETSLEDDLLLFEKDDKDTLKQSSFVEQMLHEKHAIDELMTAASHKGNVYENSLSDDDAQYHQQHHHHPPLQEQKKDVTTDLVVVVDDDDALNQTNFLETMSRDAKTLAELMKTRPPSKAVTSTAATPKDDMYIRAATRLQQLAQASRDKRIAAMEAAHEKEIRRSKKQRQSMPAFNGPLTALSVLAAGISLGMAMNAPGDATMIWNLNGMGTLDWSDLDFPSNWLDLTRLHFPAGLAGSSLEVLQQMSRQATDFQERVLATKDVFQYYALPVVQETVLQRVAVLRESLPTAQDLEAVQENTWELAQNADQQVMQKLRDMQSLSLPVVQMDNIVAQVRGVWSDDSTTMGTFKIPSPDELMLKLNEATDWMAAQTSAAVDNVDMSTIVSSVESATQAFFMQLQNAQESMGSSGTMPDMSALLTQADQIKENALTQAGNLQTELSFLQDRLSTMSTEFIESSIPIYKEALVSQMNAAAGAVQSTMSNIDTEGAKGAVGAQVNALQASLSQVHDSLAILSGSFNEALPFFKEHLLSRVSEVKEATQSVSSNIDLQMPDLSSFYVDMNDIKQAATAQVNVLKLSLTELQDSLAVQSAGFMDSLPSYKEALLPRAVNDATESVQSIASNIGVQMPELSSLNIQIEGVKEAIMEQVGAMQSSFSQVQDSLATQSNGIIDTLPSTKDAIVSRMNGLTETMRSLSTSNTIDAESTMILPDLAESVTKVIQFGDDAIRDLQKAAQDTAASMNVPSIMELPAPTVVVGETMTDRAQLLQNGMASIQTSVVTTSELPQVNTAAQTVDASGLMSSDDLKEILKSIPY